MSEIYVTRAALPTHAEFTSPDLGAALEHVASQSAPGMSRLAIWRSSPPPDAGPDAVVCVPLGVLVDCERRAAEVVDRWEQRWLLIESMPRRHRDEARNSLQVAILSSLLEAVVKGMLDGAEWKNEDEDDLVL